MILHINNGYKNVNGNVSEEVRNVLSDIAFNMPFLA